MLTRADKQLIAVVGILLIAAIVSSIMTGDDSEETVWIPEGLYVLAYDSTPFIENGLPEYIDEFTARTGMHINVIRTTQWDEALVRALVDDMPIDVIMVPFDMREELRRQGKVIDLHTVLDEYPNPNFQTAMRWLWSSINDQPICGFLIGVLGDPTFACIWYQSKYAEHAAEFIKYLVVNTSTSEDRLLQLNHVARKLLVEEDYGPIYDYLLHPSRREAISRDEFIRRSRQTWCNDGIIQDVRVRNLDAELNTGPKIDRVTGNRYESRDLLQYPVEYYCVRDGRRVRSFTYIIRTNRYPPPGIFIPFETFITWPSPSGPDQNVREPVAQSMDWNSR